MPELPDLLYIVSRLRERLLERSVHAQRLREPVLLRCLVRGNLSLLLGRRLLEVVRKSHFVILRFEGFDLLVNPMLAGRFRHFLGSRAYRVLMAALGLSLVYFAITFARDGLSLLSRA